MPKPKGPFFGSNQRNAREQDLTQVQAILAVEVFVLFLDSELAGRSEI